MGDSLKIKITATASVSEYSQSGESTERRQHYQKFTVFLAKKQFLVWKPVLDLQTPCNKLNYRLCEGSVAVWLLLTSRHLKRLSYKICSNPAGQWAQWAGSSVKFRIIPSNNDCMTKPGLLSSRGRQLLDRARRNTLNSTLFWLPSESGWVLDLFDNYYHINWRSKKYL